MSRTIVTRLAFGAAALAGVAALGACGTTTSAAPAAQNQAPADGNTMYDTHHASGNGANPGNDNKAGDSKAGNTGGTGHVDPPATRRCGTDDLKLEVGAPVEKADTPGQYDLELTYRNISGSTCALYGVPGVDLVGPNDPVHGDTYSLPRINNGPAYNEVPAGSSAKASITFLAADPSETDPWIPTTIVTTPPGQYTQLTASWPGRYSVLRQDSATHPGTWVNGFLGTTD